MRLQKQDLAGTHYAWAEERKHLFAGQPSRRGFDRYNGHQVLFLINYYASLTDQFTIQDGKSIEEKILYGLPEDAKSEISVFNWIKSNVYSVE